MPRLRPSLLALLSLATPALAQTTRVPFDKGSPTLRMRKPTATLDVKLGFAKLEVRTDQPLTSAAGGVVPLTIRYLGGGSIAALQVPGSLSYPIGPFNGSFDHTIQAADVRAILKRDEAAIVTRCRDTLAQGRADSASTVHDAQIPFVLTSAEGATVVSTTLGYQVGLLCKAPPPPLVASITYAKIGYIVGEPLASATGGLVDVNVTYNGDASVASAQFPGVASYPIGARTGSFVHTIKSADIRSILRRDEAQIASRCTGSLDRAAAAALDTVHDAQIPVTVNAANGATVASTSVTYQLGLECKRPLAVTLGYTSIVVDVTKPLANATGGLVPFSVTYNGSATVASVQVPGSMSLPLTTRTGPFQHTVPNADIRAILKRDEPAILARCRGTLETAKTTSAKTVHDAVIPMTVNAPGGAAVATTNVTYQLGLTCTRP